MPSRRGGSDEPPEPPPPQVNEIRPRYMLIGGDAAYSTTRLSSKNQITLPAAMLRLLDIKPGDELSLVLTDDGIGIGKRVGLMAMQGAMDNNPMSDKEIDEWCRIVREGGELP